MKKGVIHSIVALVAACVAVIHLFWEIAIVYEDLGLQAGLIRGHTIMRSSLGEVARLLITILLTSGIVNLLLTWLAQYYLGYLLAILIWSIIGASLYVAVIHCYSELVKRDAPDVIANEMEVKK